MKDWSKISDATIICSCGARFRGKAQIDFGERGRGIVSEKPCPACGKTDGHRAIKGDTERWTL